VDAFNLLFAGSVLAFGSLSDRFGRKRMLLAGLSVFGLASLGGGLTGSPGQLIAARAVMGVGAAMVFPSTLSLLTNVFTERRERALAIRVRPGPTAPGSRYRPRWSPCSSIRSSRPRTTAGAAPGRSPASR
jgi:MFS family permease